MPLTCIVGPMFSGKSTEFVRHVEKAVFAKEKVVVYKPNIDHRYGSGVTCHNSLDLEKLVGISPGEAPCNLMMIEVPEWATFVAFDEVQFFGPAVVRIIEELIEKHKKVVCAGLDLDSEGNPFGCVPQLLALADTVIKLTAVCTMCHKPATRTYRTTQRTMQVAVGGSESYEARCLSCWLK